LMITTVARMSAAKCGDHRKSENPDVASLIRATLAPRDPALTTCEDCLVIGIATFEPLQPKTL
jgi:hypothetical protein